MVSETSDIVVMSLDEIFALAYRVLSGAGLSRAHAEAVAHTIMVSERDACASHGLHRLPGCVMTIRSGKLSLDAEPKVEDVTPSLVRVDAGYGYSRLAFDRGTPSLAEKARRCGIAAMAINDCFHFSALWPEVEALTDLGLAALVMTPSHAWVAPAGGTRGLLGTNPIAFGWPRSGRHPYVFDFATSAMARSELARRKSEGTPIVEDIGLGPDGAPTTDAAAALDGAMLTFGGHKGSALSTMIELMAGPLIGDRTSLASMEFDEDLKLAPCHGELVMAFDPAVMAGGRADQGTAWAEALFSGFAEQGARLPSERRYAARARTAAEGVPVPRPLHERLLALES